MTQQKSNGDLWADKMDSIVKEMVSNPFLKAVYATLKANKTLWSNFKNSPGASKNHHNYKHGLIRHTLSMLEIAHSLWKLKYYGDHVDYEILALGVIVHDPGIHHHVGSLCRQAGEVGLF